MNCETLVSQVVSEHEAKIRREEQTAFYNSEEEVSKRQKEHDECDKMHTLLLAYEKELETRASNIAISEAECVRQHPDIVSIFGLDSVPKVNAGKFLTAILTRVLSDIPVPDGLSRDSAESRAKQVVCKVVGNLWGKTLGWLCWGDVKVA